MSGRMTRRTTLTLLGATAAGLPLAPQAAADAAPADPLRAGPPRVYLGAYTDGDPGGGAGVATADPDTGALVLETVVPVVNPSFLAVSAAPRVLYAVNELADGRVSAFALDADGGVLGALGSSPSGGDAPCHLSVHPAGGHLFTANYNSGTVAVVALGADGSPGEVTQIVRHTGSGPHPGRQTGPHAHMVLPDPSGERLFAVDLGTDSVHVYAFDATTGTLTPVAENAMPPGSGPRHLALHPAGRTAYVLGELDSTLTACAYDAAAGTLTPVSTVSTLPAGTDPAGSSGAEVLVSADGRFVYVSNRGHDSIAVFSVADGQETRPRPLAHHFCGGATPRHMALDAGGSHLYVANQDSDSVALFHRDAADGGLTPAAGSLSFPRPTCALPVTPV